MADNILKLRVESSEYDQKLKKAAEGIRHLAEVAHKGGGELTGLEKAELDYVKALGSMETKSRTAAGSVRELENTFKELTVVYNNLNDVEKQDEGGKALRASLDQLKQRAQAARAELDKASKSLKDNEQSAQQSGGILESLAGKFTLNIDALKLFDMGLSATKAALDVAKDAFFASESNVDEWGRTVAASQSLYEGFLTALNTGDISGYLSRIDEIVSAARTAYNELDRLGTMKTIQAPKVSAQQTENERIRSMIQTGRYIAPVDSRRNAVFNGREMQNGDKLTAGQIRALEKQLQNGMQNVVKLVGNEVKQTGKAIDAVYERQAKELGISLKEFRKGTSSMEEFDKRMAGYDKYQQWREQHTTIDQQSGREIVARGNPYAEYGKWGTFRVDGDRYNQLVQLIQQRDQQAAQAYGMQSQAYRTMNRAEGLTVRKIMGDTGGKGGNTIKEEKDDFVEVNGLINMATERVNDLQKRIREAPTETTITTLRDQLKEAQAELDRLNGKKVEMAQGLSGFNTQTMGAWLQGRQSDLSKAEYGSKEYKDISANIADMNSIKTVLDTAIKNAIDTTQIDMTPLWSKMFDETLPEGATASLSDVLTKMYEQAFDSVNIDDASMQGVIDKINEKLKELNIEPIQINFKTGNIANIGKETEKSWRGAASAMSAAGSALQGLEDPGAKIAGIVGQAIANIALGFSQATAASSGGGIFGWIAAIAGGLTTMLSTISAIHSATGYAQGGIVDGRGGGFVGGMAYSGDNVGNVRLDSGELVLNRSQQNNLANALEGGNNNNVENRQPYVNGELIYLGVNNYLKRTGRGEIVVSKK